MKARVRKRDEISSIRKKIEYLENLKKLNNKRGGTPFKDLELVKPTLRQLYNEIYAIEQELTDLSNENNGVDVQSPRWDKEVEKLKDDKMFSVVDEGTIQYIYEDIAIFLNGVNVPIGNITMRAAKNGMIRFQNDESIYINSITHQHPHIRSGTACFGEFLPIINAALKKGNLTEFIELVRHFLSIYNESSPFLTLRHWIKTYNYLECGCLEGDCGCDPQDQPADGRDRTSEMNQRFNIILESASFVGSEPQFTIRNNINDGLGIR